MKGLTPEVIPKYPPLIIKMPGHSQGTLFVKTRNNVLPPLSNNLNSQLSSAKSTPFFNKRTGPKSKGGRTSNSLSRLSDRRTPTAVS